jgi:hypothetical protein
MAGPRGLVLLAAAAALAIVFLSTQWRSTPYAGASAYSIVTDGEVYSPGDLVTITGAGYQPMTAYDVVVRRPDGSIVTGSGSGASGFDSATADVNGNLAYLYTLTDPIAPEGVYIITVYATADATHAALLALATF